MYEKLARILKLSIRSVDISSMVTMTVILGLYLNEWMNDIIFRCMIYNHLYLSVFGVTVVLTFKHQGRYTLKS